MSPNFKILSVVIPCFNEEKTIYELVSAVLLQEVVGQIIIVDDASTDRSVEVISGINDPRIHLVRHHFNSGKGSAINTGFKHITMPYVLIQDADLEYSPTEYTKLLKPLLDGYADVVYGSRFLTSETRRAVYFWHRVGNSVLTLLSNMATNIDLTDMETCFKCMKTSVAKILDIQEQRFGIEPEMTAKFATAKLRIYEVPVSYYGRTYEEGKKITWKDGFSAIYCIWKYNRKRYRTKYVKQIKTY